MRCAPATLVLLALAARRQIEPEDGICWGRSGLQAQRADDYPFPIRPGADETVVVPFVVSAAVAGRPRTGG